MEAQGPGKDLTLSEMSVPGVSADDTLYLAPEARVRIW